jgi:hypothetical protein
MPWFRITGEVRNREIIAYGHGIRDLSKLRANYGNGNWSKCKGEATIEVTDGRVQEAEIHWYEAHGIGKRRMKLKRYLD